MNIWQQWMNRHICKNASRSTLVVLSWNDPSCSISSDLPTNPYYARHPSRNLLPNLVSFCDRPFSTQLIHDTFEDCPMYLLVDILQAYLFFRQCVIENLRKLFYFTTNLYPCLWLGSILIFWDEHECSSLIFYIFKFYLSKVVSI